MKEVEGITFHPSPSDSYPSDILLPWLGKENTSSENLETHPQCCYPGLFYLG